MSRTLTSNGTDDLSRTFGETRLPGQRIVWGRKSYTAGGDTKAGKHEPHLTPSLLSSTSPYKLVFWFVDSWQAALFAIQRLFNKSICLGIIINLHVPPTAHPSPPCSSLSSFPFLSLSFSFISRVHLHVWGKGVEMAGDDGARGAFPWPTESMIHKPHDQLVSLSKANRSDTHTHTDTHRGTPTGRPAGWLSAHSQLRWTHVAVSLTEEKKRFTFTHLRGRAQIETRLQSWSGAVTRWYTNTYLDKYTGTVREPPHARTRIPTNWHTHFSHTHTHRGANSLSLSLARSAALPLSLTPSHPHTHTTTVYQWVTSGEPEGSAEMNVKILTLVIVLLVSLLCSASAGEYRSGQSCRWSSPFALYFSLCVPWACAGSCSWSVTQHG